MQQIIGCWQAQQLPNFAMGSIKIRGVGGPRKDKVVVVMGATGTGKSRLAVDLATHFGGEIINSDKMQLYDDLDVVTNKVTKEERAGIPHHLLGGVPGDVEFSSRDFRRRASLAIESVVDRGWLPIIAGGSNSYIEELINGDRGLRYDCCFVWVDVEVPVLHEFVAERVDRMVERGLVEEVRGLFDPAADYTRGVRRAIGVPEMDKYLRAEQAEAPDEAVREWMLAVAVEEIKANTCKLACCQLKKIHRLRSRWDVHRVNATAVFEKRGMAADEAWEEMVAGPSIEIVERFLLHGGAASTAVMSAAAAAAMGGKLLPATVEAVGATV